MRILVTGASGLLGVNLAMEAAKAHTVFGATHTNALRADAFFTIQTDLLAPAAVERLLNETQPDWVINCAALAIVDACEANPALARKLNVDLPRNLANHVARGGARLVHISTDAVFDGERGDYSEEDEPNPLSVYARTKLEGEQVVRESDPEAIIARVNLYGWSLSGKRSLAEWFYNNLTSGVEMLGFTNIFFCPLLVNDLGNILLEMLANKLHGLYHVVSRDCISKYEFGVALARHFGFDEKLIKPASVAQSNLLARRSPRLTLRSDRLTRDLGAQPPDLSTGLERFYALYQQGYPQALRELLNEE
jgi:dTDP-4-dehydrorhamnose reductase